jgi:hypothetical protein
MKCGKDLTKKKEKRDSEMKLIRNKERKKEKRGKMRK